ncbi:MAG: M28 family peptidase [Leptolyngbyaceae cyanobacterium bins.349]|nr:M28 family peptidase [Leptolyngbyaceae cyanobacterium bins.349]
MRLNFAIALFDREEQGLVGSLTFTANLENLNNLVGAINLEMLGYTCNTPGCQTYPEGLPMTPPSDRGDFLGIVGDREHDYLLQAFQLAHSAELPSMITIPIPFKGILTPDVLRSDHAPFWARNIGAVMISDTANFRNPHYHQPSDTLDTLDLAFFTRATQLVVNATTVLLDSKNGVAELRYEYQNSPSP